MPKHFARILAICTVAQLGIAAQERGTYVAYKKTTLSAAAETVTVQQPASGSAIVTFVYAEMWCSVDCTFTLKRSGTAASSTSLTPTPINSFYPASLATAWHTSNVGAGTTVDTYEFKQGADPIVIDLREFRLAKNSTTQNLSISTSSITGTAKITIQFKEKY